MPHIEVDPALPGIIGLFDHRPETATPLAAAQLDGGMSTVEQTTPATTC